MKAFFLQVILPAFSLGLLFITPASAQTFQRVFGTAFDNSFTKVVRSGTSYYVIGRDEPTNGAVSRATVTRLNAQGQHQWTLSMNTGSQWNDAVITSGGNLLVVGNTLPGDANSQSLMGLVTPSGAFSWLRSYNVPGREGFNRVVRNPSPDNGSFPYYVLGFQWDPAGNSTWDDVVLLTLNEAGAFGWKKIYTGLFGSSDDEFIRDLEALPNGDLVMAGNLDSQGAIFKADNTGSIGGAAGPAGVPFSFQDVAQTSGGFYAVGSTFPNVVASLMKFDNDLVITWQITLSELTAISQVWRDNDGDIYVTGRMTVGNLNRPVLLKFQDFGDNPAFLWLRYLEYNDLSYTGGSSWYMPPNQIAFADGRERIAGFGKDCAFLSLSDLELATCMTVDGFITQLSADYLFESPVPPNIDFFDTPPATNLTQSSALNWQQDDACASCEAEFTFQKVGGCTTFQFTNNSSGPPPLTYSWNFGDPASGANNTSTAQNPAHTFSSCDTFTVCLILTGAGCMDTICHTVVVEENTPPTLGCPSSLTANTDPGACYFSGSLEGELLAMDNCDLSPDISCSLFNGINFVPILPGHQFPKGDHTIRCRAMDFCGNLSNSCTFTLTVEDKEPPSITCPISQTILGTLDSMGQCKAVVHGLAPTASDNCPMLGVNWKLSGATIGQGIGDASGTNFMQGTTTVTYTAVDMAGNSSACSFTIEVKCALGSILVVKYNDKDCDGLQDLDPVGNVLDPGLPGWFFTVTNTATGQTYTGATNAQGQLIFSNLPPGTYTVTETPQPGWTPSNPASGSMTVIVGPGGVTYAVFGNCPGCLPAPKDSLCDELLDVLFVLDNSGSIDLSEYAAISQMAVTNMLQIESVYSNAQYAMVHYGGDCGDKLYVEYDFGPYPFPGSIVRRFPPGYHDDLNASLGDVLDALNHVPNANLRPTASSFLNARPGARLQVIIYTDAWPFVPLNNNCANSALLPFTNSILLKQTKSASISVVHVEPTIPGSQSACAAIASPGGTYVGPVDNNSYDSGLPGPRQFIPWTFGSPYVNILPELPPCDSSLVDNCCDSLMVMPTITSSGGKCCATLDLKNKVGYPIYRLDAEIINSPGWVFNTGSLAYAAGFVWAATPTNQLISLGAAAGFIPNGTSNAALTFCLASTSTAPAPIQTIVFRWYGTLPGSTDTVVVCTDTLRLECPEMNGSGCVALVDSTLHCNPDNPYEYFFNFTVQNLSGSPINQIVLQNLPAGFGFSFCNASIAVPSIALTTNPNPLPNGAISNNLCVKIISPVPILSPTLVCFRLGLVGDSICCHATDSICVLLKPCCDPCDMTEAVPQVLASPVDGCCFKLDLERKCQYDLFSRVETEILTTGVIFGYHALGGPDAANWFVFPGATPTNISYGPIAGAITQDHVDDIIQFCLDNITSPSQIPQTVVVRWYTGLPPIEKLVCTDTLTFHCELDFKCVEVDAQIECLPDSNKYLLTMQVTNQSSIPFGATDFHVSVVSPPDLYLFPTGGIFPLVPPLTSGNSTTVTTCIASLSNTFPSPFPYIVLNYRLGWYNGSSFDTCCFESKLDTLWLPPCDTCVCESFTNLSFYNFLGHADVPVICNSDSIYQLPCIGKDALYTFQGSLLCIPDTCAPQISYQVLDASGGLVTAGVPDLQIGSHFIINSLSYLTFPGPGDYMLVFQGICGNGDTCFCKINFRVPECCTCGIFDMEIRLGGAPNLPVHCGDVVTVGPTFALYPSFQCQGPDCPPSANVYWELTGPSPFVPQSGTETATPAFTISPLSPGNFTLPGNYLLTMEGYCGTDTCPCAINLVYYDSCCTDSLAFVDAVANFQYFGTLGNCTVYAEGTGLSECMQVTWYWGDGFSTGPVSNGTPVSHTYPATGTYTLCYLIEEVDETGAICWSSEKCDTIEVLCDSCCIDMDLFCQTIINATTITVDNQNCKATFALGNLPDCDRIEFLNWGEGPPVIGPIPPGSTLMHTYSGSGTYIISYLAVESDPLTGSICFEKVFRDTITLACDTCRCLGADNLSFVGLDSISGGQIQVVCGSPDTVRIPCALTGVDSFWFHGDVHCTQDSCLQDSFTWSYTALPPFIGVSSGGTLSFNNGKDGHFDILLQYADYAPGTTYALSVTHYCGSQGCTCTVLFQIEECDTCCTDQEAFFKEIYDVQTNEQISKCHISVNGTGLGNCRKITWDWGDGSPVEGPYPDNTPVSHTYTGVPPGPYTICYTIIEYDANGEPCWSAQLCLQEQVFCDTCAHLPEGLVAWWPMNDPFGNTTAADIYGNHPATPKPGSTIGNNSPTPTLGKVLDALHFVSPGNQHLEVSDAPDLNFGSNSFAMDAWVYTDMGTQTEPIVNKLRNQNAGYALSIQGTSPYYLTLVLGMGSSVQVLQGPPIIPGEWNFVAVSVDGAAQTASFYVGNSAGWSASTVSIGGVHQASNTLPLLIGNNPSNLHWNIVIDELEIFNRSVLESGMQLIWKADSLGKCPPETCVCQGHPEIFLSKDSTDYLIGCSHGPFTPVIPCSPGPVIINGNFGCVSADGNPCPATADWRLEHPLGTVLASGTAQSNSVYLFPAAQVNDPGGYHLFLETVCPGSNDTCRCVAYWIQEACDSCACGGFDKIKLVQKQTSFSQNLVCNNQPPLTLACPPVGKPYKISGRLICNPANCPATGIQWTIKKDGMIVSTGTQPGPWFSVTLDQTTFAAGNGLYTVTLTGICGNQTCACVLNFLVDGCPPASDCLCDAEFIRNVQKGFSWKFVDTSDCSIALKPNALTPCDTAVWAITGPNGFSQSGTSTYNNPVFVCTIPAGGSGIYMVTMWVYRRLANGELCHFSFKKIIDISCPPAMISCDDTVLDNGGFAKNAEPGVLGGQGQSDGWSGRLGSPEIIGDDGCRDPFYLKLEGKCIVNQVEIADHPVQLTSQKGYRLSLCYQIAEEDLQPGTELVVRLSEAPQMESVCGGQCAEIARIGLSNPTCGNWETVHSNFFLEGWEGTRYLTLHLENELAYDEPGEANSRVFVDNICLQQDDDTNVGAHVPATDQHTVLLFPNPNTGAFTLDFQRPVAQGVQLRITDPSGRLIRIVPVPVGVQQQSLVVTDLPGGLYFLTMYAEGRPVAVKKFVKQ